MHFLKDLGKITAFLSPGARADFRCHQVNLRAQAEAVAMQVLAWSHGIVSVM